MDRNRKRFIAPLLGLAAIIVAVAIYMMVTMPSKDVDMPLDDASPEQVVAAYMEALDAHDCDDAQALGAPSKRENTALWCRNVGRMADIEVADHVAQQPALSGHTASLATAARVAVVGVPVTFDLKWRLFRSDVSMPDGPTSWGYFLARESPTEPWRVFGEGVG